MATQLIKNTDTDVTEFVDELGAGVVKEILATILSEASIGVANYGEGNKKAKITIDLTLSRFNGVNQVDKDGTKYACAGVRLFEFNTTLKED